ncbi:hypothetical protein N0V90_000541 [Kalmusia sp. IMI 367209]|nr:hypothetical protein N0V90_000541 [Kalmusia sp. IMI 367209]
MASLPPQRAASQRRASPPAEPTSPEQSHVARTNSFSAASVDSQTLLLNSPPTETAKPVQAAQQEASAQTTSQPTESQDEPRRCWICFNDETEDDEMTSEWRSPCPCVLVAHEKCLLDWIADMEAPNQRRRAGRTAGKILCPQCKSEIRLERPVSVAVQAVRALEKTAKLLTLPGVVFFVGTATYTTLRYAGTYTLYEIFGPEDAYQILAPLYQPPTTHTTSVTRRLLEHLRDHWRLDLGLPAIPTVLIASRTSLADTFLPFLPLVFVSSVGVQNDNLLQLTWPPSAAFTVAALPYARGIYNSFYERFCAPHERRWLKEVQPRADVVDEIDEEAQDDDEAILNAIAEEDMDGEAGDEIVEVDVDLLFDWNAGGEADNNNAPENPPVPIARGPGRPLDAPPVDEAPAAVEQDDAAPAPDVPRQPAQPRQRRVVRRERNIGFSTSLMADTILGALVFPSIAAAVGEALKYALPNSWVTLPTSGKPTGFLQARWGRSILGGCLFVGLKDALLLYVRWKMAQNHRQRRVLDFDKSKGKNKVR